MSTFVIRSQGFFYTDEYFAPGEVFKQVVKKRFATKAAADKACAALVRKWVRSEPIGNYVFDDSETIEAISKYLREEWPDKFAGRGDGFLGEIPDDATDKQVDAIVKRMGVVFAEVFEVEEDDDAEQEDEDAEGAFEDDLHFGPT